VAARTKTKVSPKHKTKYRVNNWAAYDIALRARGDITVWLDEEAIGAWNAPQSGFALYVNPIAPEHVLLTSFRIGSPLETRCSITTAALWSPSRRGEARGYCARHHGS